MYRIFKTHVARRSRKNDSKVERRNERGENDSQHRSPRRVKEELQVLDENDGQSHKDEIDQLPPPIRLTRSMSRDSFSTFTTAAETPSDMSSVRSSVIIWGDLPMPSEIYICGGNQEVECRKRITKARLLPEPSVHDTCKEDEDQKPELRFLPLGMLPKETKFKIHPSKSHYYDTRIEQPSRQRSHSNGDVDYLKAPERWTRFEI